MKDWKYFFSNAVLARGRKYYEEGLVEEVCEEDGIIIGRVNGTEDYEVEIHLYNDEVEDMFCTCPYSEDCDYCKHMAAVLFAYESEEETGAEQEEKREENRAAGEAGNAADSIAAIVQSAKEADVRAFLTEVLEQDELLRQRFIIRFSDRHSSGSDEYKKLVDSVISHYANPYGYVDYDEAEELFDDLGAFDDMIRAMVDKGMARTAFELSLYICRSVEELSVDDDVSTFFDDSLRLWEEIAAEMPPDEKEWLFQRALTEYDRANDNYTAGSLRALIVNQFQEERFHERVIAFLDREIGLCRSDAYDQSAALILKLDYLIDIGTESDKIEKLCRAHWDNIRIREWLARLYVQRNELQKAIDAYEACVAMESTRYGAAVDYRIWLLRLYRQTNNPEKALKVLWDLVCKSNSTDHYRELKSHYSPEEWLQKREKVFPHFNAYDRAQLFCEEKLYDRLWELIEDADLYTVARYENVLLPQYAAEIIAKYRSSLNRAATQVSGRKAYQEWAELLNHMKKIPGGREAAQQIAGEWRVKYRNRPAMMDELRKV